ncbi:MAG: alpha-hydroxy-acid oxidizing protein, partial [Mesorhizobium sp.]
MSDILTIADLKDLARRRVPKMFFDYADSGAWTESTYRANEEDFQKIKFRQRVLVDMSNRSLESTMIGQKVSMPVALAPTGMTGMQFTLSTMSICSIEDVASVTKKPFWFQLYVLRDKDFVLDLIDRAKAAKCSALVLTLDLQVLGQRHKDVRNGLSAPPKMTLA